MSTPKNIFPIFDEILQREDKEKMLKQRAKVIWMTGLSGSGKTTIAKQLEHILHQKGFLTKFLDGDNIRSGINNNLSFSAEDRAENIRRISEVSKLFLNCGVICINCFVSPTNDIRRKIIEIIGEENVLMVFVNTPLEVCEARDVKGLYAKARKGEIPNFTGISAPFDVPDMPYIEVKTDGLSVEESTQQIVEAVLPHLVLETEEK